MNDYLVTNDYLRYQKGASADFINTTIERNNLKGLRVTCNTPSDKLDDLGFLGNFTFLKGLEISSTYPYDLSFLNNLKGLTELSLVLPEESSFNIGNLQGLQSLAIKWPNKSPSLENCTNIEKLILIEFAEKDLCAIASLKQLKILQIKTSRIQSLAGVERLRDLQELKVGNARSLKHISHLNGLLNLIVLELESTSKVQDLDLLENLPKLQILRLVSVGEIGSLQFITKFPSLKTLALLEKTIIRDGNLTYVNHIKDFFYKNHKHYFGYTQISNQEEIVRRNLEKLKKRT